MCSYGRGGAASYGRQRRRGRRRRLVVVSPVFRPRTPFRNRHCLPHLLPSFYSLSSPRLSTNYASRITPFSHTVAGPRPRQHAAGARSLALSHSAIRRPTIQPCTAIENCALFCILYHRVDSHSFANHSAPARSSFPVACRGAKGIGLENAGASLGELEECMQLPYMVQKWWKAGATDQGHQVQH